MTDAAFITGTNSDRLSVRDLALIVVELALVLVLVWQFHLEEKRHLLAGLSAVSGGFLVHALLPRAWRLRWFLCLSLGCIVLVLGPVEAGYAIGIGSALIAATFFPVPFSLRLLLILMLAGTFAWWRKDSAHEFWPIVGSMFMFRLIVYLYSIRNERTTRSPLAACSYFFLLPNAFFPLFPVVDYKTYCDSYYNDERRRIYQTGIHWMAVGVLHLLLYRLIKSRLLPEPLDLRSATDVAQFLLANYALYIRISGQFHLICGMLHLFGFNLPRTHDHYFLASSFSDIWRRINIYWKDFMAKVFFFPVFFRLRRHGNLVAVSGGVMWVFLWTWLGHSWQVYWLLGEFPFQMQDAVLWLGVGVVVAASALADYRRAASGRGAGRGKRGMIVPAAVHVLKILGVLTTISLFWAWWSNPEIVKLLIVSSSTITVGPRDLLVLGGGVLGAIVVGVGVQYLRELRIHGSGGRLREGASFDRSIAVHLLPMIALVLLTQPTIASLYGPGVTRLIAELQTDRMTHREALAAIDGYYEQLNEGSLQAGPFLGDPAPPRPREAIDFSDMIRYRRDLLGHELVPGWRGSWLGAEISVNRWGMRDLDRTLVKPPGTYRVAVVGSSVVMGYGVGDEETFCRLLEKRLNGTSAGTGYEVLNFGSGRYFPIHRRCQIEHKVLAFQPDMILYVAHQDELYSSMPRIAAAVFQGIDLEDPHLDALLVRAGIRDGHAEPLIRVALSERHPETLKLIYDRLHAIARARQIRFVQTYVPIPGQHEMPFDPRICLDVARRSGLDAVDCSDWWGEFPSDQVLLGETEFHPAPVGHRLIADALEPIVRRRLNGSENID